MYKSKGKFSNINQFDVLNTILRNDFLLKKLLLFNILHQKHLFMIADFTSLSGQRW